MTPELSEALKNLREILQKESHHHCVGINVFFNTEGITVNYDLRSPGGLKRDNKSMRNIKGEWVK